MDLPVLVWMVSPRAWGLGPRRANAHLAMAVRVVWPSAYLYSVGALKNEDGHLRKPLAAVR